MRLNFAATEEGAECDHLCGLVVEYFAADPEIQVRFPALPDFLRISGSETGYTQPSEHN
jgi:hypothetical protein